MEPMVVKNLSLSLCVPFSLDYSTSILLVNFSLNAMDISTVGRCKCDLFIAKLA